MFSQQSIKIKELQDADVPFPLKLNEHNTPFRKGKFSRHCCVNRRLPDRESAFSLSLQLVLDRINTSAQKLPLPKFSFCSNL
jgi:hypothetical protein